MRHVWLLPFDLEKRAFKVYFLYHHVVQSIAQDSPHGAAKDGVQWRSMRIAED